MFTISGSWESHPPASKKYCDVHTDVKLCKKYFFGSQRNMCDICSAKREAAEAYEEAVRTIPKLTTLRGMDKGSLIELCDRLNLNNTGTKSEMADRIFALRDA